MTDVGCMKRRFLLLVEEGGEEEEQGGSTDVSTHASQKDVQTVRHLIFNLESRRRNNIQDFLEFFQGSRTEKIESSIL